MVVYHPAFDSFHCITRLSKILKLLPSKKRHLDRIRIYDYYFLFINDLENISIPVEFSEYRQYKKIISNSKYNKVISPKLSFFQLEKIQDLAIQTLASYGFINKELLCESIILNTALEIPPILVEKITEEEKKYLELVSNVFEKMSLRQLKERTKLMEYRYELS